MSRVIDATSDAAGIVRADGFVVSGAKHFGEGKAASEGALILDKDKKYYIPKTISDLVTVLDKLSNSLSQIAAGMQAIDAKPTGGTGSAPAPAAASQIANINSIKAELDALKGALK